MDIKSQYALRGYEAARQQAGAGAGNKQGAAAKALADDPFSIFDTESTTKPNPAAKAIAQNFVATVMNGEKVANQALAGQADAVSMVEALAATELAMETAVTVRDRVVSAYQEILRMPV